MNSRPRKTSNGARRVARMHLAAGWLRPLQAGRYTRELKKFEAENGPIAPKKAAAKPAQKASQKSSKKRKTREETEGSDDEEGQQTMSGTKIERPRITETPVLDEETMVLRRGCNSALASERV